MWVLSNVKAFRHWVSWIATILILAACANLVGATLFGNHRLFRIAGTSAVLLLAIITKRALLTFETNPQIAIETIEKSFYALLDLA